MAYIVKVTKDENKDQQGKAQSTHQTSTAGHPEGTEWT
jgi:hypothetical protein